MTLTQATSMTLTFCSLTLLVMMSLLTRSGAVTAQPNSSSPSSGVTSPTSDCWLVAQRGFRDQLRAFLDNGAKLIEITINLTDHPPDMLPLVLPYVYKPYHWVRSTSRQGRSLLMLNENYGFMSMSTLAIGVESMKVNLTDRPVRCLRGRGPEETLKVLRESFLRDFTDPNNPTTGSLSVEEHICNQQIFPSDGYADFRYRCCHMPEGGQILCQDMITDEWITVLLALIIIIKVMVVLYSPLFLPDSLYRLKYVAAQYIYHVPARPLTVRVVVTEDPEQYGEDNKHKTVRLSRLKNMEYFKAMVSGIGWSPEKIYEVELQEVRLSVKARRLLDSLTVPVTLLKLLYNNLLRCRIRNLEPLRACCDTNILGRFNPGLKMIKWHQCMRVFASFCLIIIIAIPWIIRATVYFAHEAPIMNEQYKAAEKLDLDVAFPGSFVAYLTPVHGLFIIIYFIFTIDSVVYGVISSAMKEKFKYVTRQCLRDMRERSRIAILSWMTKLIVMPFRVFGIVGLLFFVPYLAILLLLTLPVVTFYIFPTLNLSIRLIIHLFIFMCPQGVVSKFEELSERMTSVKERLKIREVTANESFAKRHDYTTKGIILQLIVVSMCLISFWSLTLLLMEIISFFVELFVYTFMGIIVNAGVTLQYVTVLFLLFLYSKNTFSQVHRLYQAYHKVIHRELMSMKREEINEVAKKEALDQENTSFIVTGPAAKDRRKTVMPQLKVKSHTPQWITTGMLVFLDKHDTPFTPEKFFYDTIDLNYFGCPGPIYKNVSIAVWEFLKIVLFLLFIFVVVMAFGDAYQVSTTNQLLATVVGGFVPFLFRYIFKSSTGVEDLDTSSIQFQTEFHKAINQYYQSWAVFDIIPTRVREWDGRSDADVDSGNQDGNGSMNNNNNSGGGTAGQDHPDTSTSPLLNTSGISGSSNSDNENITTEMTALDLDDENPQVDIIVDISTPSTTSVNALLTKGFERGSVSMLDKSHSKGGSARSSGGRGGSARIYRPSERRIDV